MLLRTTAPALLLASALGLAPLADEPRAWDFDDARPGATPEGFRVEVGTWEVVEAGGERALMQKARSDKPKFNLALIEGTEARDVDLSVRYRSVEGEIDQGGGLVWRARDGRTYYVARYNPLEDNYRVYTLVDGVRTQLQNADIPHSDGWHTLRITMSGDHIQCYHDGKLALDVHDSTLDDPGLIGLWTKADARTEFDDLVLKTP